jgi:photosystem II stability/assembly factor-like uncharacterized protein
VGTNHVIDRGRVPPGDRSRGRWRAAAGALVALGGLTAAAVVFATIFETGDELAESSNTVSPATVSPTTDSGPTAPTTDNGQPPPEEEIPRRWRPLDEPGVGGRITALSMDPFDPDHILVGGDLLGTARSVDGGRSWVRSEGLLSLEIARFSFRPDRPGEVWVGSMSGPHRSTDGGVTWEPRRNGFPEVEPFRYSAPVEVVVFDNRIPDRLLAFGGSHREWSSPGEPAWGAVWESLDDGGSWTRLATIADGANVVAAVQLDDGTFLVAALGQGVQRSADGGSSWMPSLDGLPHTNVRDLAVVPGTSTVYAALAEGPFDGEEFMSGGIYRSDDGGVTWGERSNGLADRRGAVAAFTSRYDAIAVSEVDQDTIWTADLAFGLERIYRSDDGGESWTVELEGDGKEDFGTTYSSPVTAEVLVADPERNELKFLGQSEYVLRREPNGDWIDATSAGSESGRFGTGFSGLVSTGVTFDPADDQNLSLNALDGGHYLRSQDAGKTWTRPLVSWDPWGGASSMSIAGPNGDHVYVLLGQFGEFGGIAASTDGQQSWAFIAGADAGLPERSSAVAPIGKIVALDLDPRRVVATIGGSIYVSTDAGASWRRTLDGTYVALARGPDDQIYVADAQAVYRLGPGADEVDMLPGSPAAVDTIRMDPTTGALYAIRWGVDDATTGLISRWDGASWTQLCLEAPSCGPGLDRYAADLAVNPNDPDHLIVATNDLPFHDVIGSQGVLESTDGGLTWAPINDGLPVLRVSVVAFDPHRPGRLVIGTMGGGFYEYVRP